MVYLSSLAIINCSMFSFFLLCSMFSKQLKKPGNFDHSFFSVSDQDCPWICLLPPHCQRKFLYDYSDLYKQLYLLYYECVRRKICTAVIGTDEHWVYINKHFHRAIIGKPVKRISIIHFLLCT